MNTDTGNTKATPTPTTASRWQQFVNFILNHKLAISFLFAATFFFFESGWGTHYPEEEYAENRMEKLVKDDFRSRQDKVEEITNPKERHKAYWNNKIVERSELNEIKNLPKGCPEDETFWVNNKKTMDVSACEVGQIVPLVLEGPGIYNIRLGEKLSAKGELLGELMREPRVEPFPFPSQWGPNVVERTAPKQFKPFGNVKYVHEGVGNVLELAKE